MKKIELTEGQKRHSNIQRVKKVFQYENMDIIIASCLADYGNNCKVEVTNVIAPNGGRIPIREQHNETLKSIQERAINVLNDFSKRGCDVRNELTKAITI